MKKKDENLTRERYVWLRRVLKIMKLTTCIILLSTMLVSAKGFSQATKLNLNYREISIGELFRIIENQSDYRFAYSRSSLNPDELVSIDVKNEELDEVLKTVLDNNNLSYKIIDSYVVISDQKNSGNSTFAVQKRKISGTVTDKSGVPLPGVTVVVKGTTSGTTTNADGSYTLPSVPETSTIVFSFIGMKTQEVQIGDKLVIDVQMQETAIGIEEVIAIGYGTQKRRDLTGSIGSVKGADLIKGNPISLTQGLQGKMAGVLVNQNDGAPGAGVSIQVRGANSYGTNTQPLYIVDGIPFDVASMPTNEATSGNNQTFNPLSLINPQDIESIEVLKDASSSAIYGSRGANGVVIITTKRGTKGKAKVEISANTGISSISKTIDVLNAYTYAKYINEGYENGVLYNGNTFYKLPYPGEWAYPYVNNEFVYNEGFYEPSPEDFLNPGIRTDEYGNTDIVKGSNWMDLITQTAVNQEYNISVSGGSKGGYYVISGNYTDQEGIIKNSDFTRYTLRTNVAQKITNWLEFGLNSTFASTETNFAKTNSFDYGIIRSAMIFPTTYAPQTDVTQIDDELTWLSANPYLYVMTAKDHMKSIIAFNSAFMELTFTDWLKFRQNLGYNYSANARGTYYNSRTGEGQAPSINGRAGQSDNWYSNVTSESILTLNKTFNEIHALNLVAGFTYENANYGNKSMTATNFPDDLTYEYDMSKALVPGKLYSGRGESSLMSFLFRANYNLNERYLFTLSFRRDGSSKFAPGNKFANFGSGAFAWRASEEEFIKNLNIFSNLKFRISYGQSGNQAIGNYATMASLATANYPLGGSLNSGVAENEWDGPVNPNLKWESTAQFNPGIDVGFSNNKVTFTIDYYNKKTTDLLQNVKIPTSSGFSQMTTNFGWVKNEGLEISGNFYFLNKTELKWNMTGNISFNRNRIGGLSNDQYASKLWNSADYVFIQRNNMPIGAIYGYVEDGFYNNEAEVRANPVYANASEAIINQKIGEIKYLNLDDDPNITEADRTMIGDTNPDYIIGINNEFNWRNFNFEFFLQGVFGNDIFNGNLMDVTLASIGNIPTSAYEGRWTPDNYENASWPKVNNGYNREWLISNRYIEDGSYLRLKNMTFGYDFKSPFQGVSSIKVFANATNLFTITKYSWFDPDVNSFGGDASRRGVDIHAYPSSRTYSLGVKIIF